MKRVAICLTAVALVFGLGACGGDDSSQQGDVSNGDKPGYEPGEKSVENFGAEAEGSDRQAVLTAEQAYLTALASRDYTAACSHMTVQTQKSLQQVVVKRLRSEGCPAILPKLLSPTAPAVARQQANGKISKVRVDDDRAFVIFRAPGAKLYVFTMQREDDAWKATTVAASILVPSAATLGSG